MKRESWNRRYAAVDLVWGRGPNLFLEAELLDMDPQGRALDLACGEGRNAIWLARRGWKVTAVDFSEVAVEKGRLLAVDSRVEVEWIVADVTRWPAPEEAFALAVVLYLQVSAEDRRSVVDSAVSALAPGGKLLMIGHARRNLDDGVGGPLDPELLWEPRELAAEVAAAGAVVTFSEERSRRVDSESGSSFAIDTVLESRRIR